MSENETREKLIDKQLKEAGWKKEYIKEEVNTIKSDFSEKQYILFDGETEQGEKYIDYLLLADDYSPLAIIEAKTYSTEPDKGRVQARSYREDIKVQTNKNLPIFLTNGETWKIIDHQGRERKISGAFSQENISRREKLYASEKNPADISINNKIVDRDKSVLNVKKLAEHFSEGHRKALVEMATGTGKTRVAMALIDILMRANIIRNVLFVADRINLADQAGADGFKRFFDEPVRELHREGFGTTSSFYTSTVQTLMGKEGNRLFENFNPGFFDLVIFDESHRSIYDKQNMIFEYFDAIKIGLTATPKEIQDRNTYELFGCEIGKPTVEYPYDEAVEDGILVPYIAEVIGTKVLSLGIKGENLASQLKDQLKKQEVDPEATEFTGRQFDKIFMDDKTNELIIKEFLNRCYRSDDNLPTKTIFFCASVRHTEKLKKMFDDLTPSISSQVQSITADKYRASDEISRFKNNSEPRIALSVGMLDTGVDIPEVCNLVFLRPVFSSTRFWQMLGRGTRNRNSCHHPEWLPNLEKNDFLILDFALGGHSNIMYHKLEKGEEKERHVNPLVQIFKQRVHLLEKELDPEQKKIIFEKIHEDINKLDEDSFIVREKLSSVKELKGTFELDKYLKKLKEDIAPLIMTTQGPDPKVTSFVLKVEKLFRYILDDNKESIQNIRLFVEEKLKNVLTRDNLEEVNSKKDNIIKTLQDKFWEDLTFEKVEFIISELAPLIKYYQKDRISLIQIDAPDEVLQVAEVKYQLKENLELKEFIENNSVLQKIKSGEAITSQELMLLERDLSNLDSKYTIKKVQDHLNMDFLLFIHQIVGLTKEYDPKKIIEREFDKYIMQTERYNSNQIEFLLLLKKFFADKKHIELKDFAEEPLRELGPLDRFDKQQLENIVEICNTKIKMK